jgi:hypothetical protein
MAEVMSDYFDRTVCPPPCNTMHSYSDGERAEDCAHEPAEPKAEWKVERVPARIRPYGKQREFVWEVTCPHTPPEPSWENDFGRGQRCGCRRFPTEGKARRYVERMVAAQ